ncbi:MAG: tetratricopeptide repeat protein [Crocinitomicaceae bacterium]
MKNSALILLLLFYLTNSFFVQSQSISRKDLEGIFFGKIRAKGSMSGQDIALRFYEDGEVIALIVPKRPSYMDNFSRSFDRGTNNRVSKGKYVLEGEKITFEINLVMENRNGIYSFQGNLSFTKSIKVILFTLFNKSTGIGYRLYSERVWEPEKGAVAGYKEKPEIDKNEEKNKLPSVVETNKNIQEEIQNLDENLNEDDLAGATKNLNNIGLSQFENKNYEEAINSFNDALVLSEMSGDQRAAANIRNNLGASHERLNQKNAALKNFELAVRDYKALGDDESAAKVMYQIALLQRNHLENKEEEATLMELIKLEEKVKDPEEISATYNSMAINLMKQSRPEEARKMLEVAMKVDEKNNFKANEAISINNLGNIQFEAGNVNDAINSYKQALVIKEELNDKGSQAITFHNLGNALYTLGDFKKAEEHLRKSLLLAREASSVRTMNANYRALANLLADANSCTDPLDNYKSYITMRFAVFEADEIKPLYEEKAKYLDANFNSEESLSEEVQKLGMGNDDLISINMLQEDLRQAQKQAKQEVEIKEKEVALLESQNMAQKERAKTLTWMVIGAGVSGGLVLILLGLALRAKNRTKKDKQKIEEQKEVIEEKNKNFMDSVNYASRLQTAILPPEPVLSKYLNEFFVLYKPKDIVAGDFYWTESVGNYVYVAAADCTGHGVPGAMVSVVCSNSLNRAVNEFGLRDTGEILDKTKELVIRTFEKSVEEVKDGMDITLVRFEKGTQKIQYTGANNSLVIVRDQQGKKALEEYKADKQPVGQYAYSKNFTTHFIDVNPGDQLFLFSDGYADQFGGEKGKKMKVRALKDLLMDVSELPLKDQKEKLDLAFNQWKGDYEQVDDVCVIGVRV